MDRDQIEALRDKLIAKQKAGPSPLAIKFEPMLQDRATGLPANEEELARIEAECEELVARWHPYAIEQLRQELANDPEGLGYAGKDAEEIQRLLTTPREVHEEHEVQDGSGMPAWLPQLAALIRNVPVAQIRSEIKVNEPAPRTERVLVDTLVPRASVIWQKIPYCRNVPSLDNIAEALK